MFIRENGKDILITQVYVDDIIYGSTYQSMVDEFVKTMTKEFEMSRVGELSYFLGLKIKQLPDGITVS